MPFHFRIDRKKAKRPHVMRVFVWSLPDSPAQPEAFGGLIQRLAPGPTHDILLGSGSEADRARLQSIGRHLEPSQLPDVVRLFSSHNLQLYWPEHGQAGGLEIICELYDEHIEVLVPEPIRTHVEAVLSEYDAGAA